MNGQTFINEKQTERQKEKMNEQTFINEKETERETEKMNRQVGETQQGMLLTQRT